MSKAVSSGIKVDGPLCTDNIHAILKARAGSVLISNNPWTFVNKGSRFVALDHRHSKGWIFLHQGIPDKMYYSEEWRRIRQKGLSSAAKKVVMCNYPRLYCTNGENVPDLLNGQQRLNPVRADSVTMVITVAFLVLAPFFFYISNPPKSGQNNGRNYFTAIIEI